MLYCPRFSGRDPQSSGSGMSNWATFTEPLYGQSRAGIGEELTRLINGYIAYLKQSKQGANEPGSAHP